MTFLEGYAVGITILCVYIGIKSLMKNYDIVYLLGENKRLEMNIKKIRDGQVISSINQKNSAYRADKKKDFEGF